MYRQVDALSLAEYSGVLHADAHPAWGGAFLPQDLDHPRDDEAVVDLERGARAEDRAQPRVVDGNPRARVAPVRPAVLLQGQVCPQEKDFPRAEGQRPLFEQSGPNLGPLGVEQQGAVQSCRGASCPQLRQHLQVLGVRPVGEVEATVGGGKQRSQSCQRSALQTPAACQSRAGTQHPTARR